jgi:hypothetical protein
MPAISERGQFISSGLTNKDLKAKVEELNKKEEGRKVAERMIKVQKAALENKLITSIKGILELSDNYASLVKPNDTYLLKDDIADKIQDDVIEYNRFENVHDKIKLGKKGQKVISPTRILEVPYNLHKHDVNMIGKKVLGMIAVENSLHPVFNSIGAYLPKTYKASVWNQEQQKYEDIDQNYDVRLFLPHNKTDNGEVSLSGTDTADGLDNIAELYSQMMNGAVDVEKDAWIFFIQGNYEVAPVLLYLIKAGVPAKEAIYFVSQPLVRESYINPKYTYEVNTLGTVNILNILNEIKFIKSALIITTDKVYLNNDKKNYYKENDILEGFDPYSNSKSCAELVVNSYNRSFFKKNNIFVATARAGNVVGGGDFSKDRILPDYFRALLKNNKLIVNAKWNQNLNVNTNRLILQYL